MKDQLFTALSAVAGISVLLVAGIVAGTAPRLPGSIEPSALVETIEGDAVEAAEDAFVPKRKHRHSRASLSMPYFSFAQSLRPRG